MEIGYPGYTHTSWRPLQSWRLCTLGILTHPGDLYNLGDCVPYIYSHILDPREGVSWLYSHILETSTILDSMYPGYTHTSWRPVQSWTVCTLSILTHPGDLYNLGDHVPWVYSHILETSTILEIMYPGYTHTSWRPLQSWTACTLGILTHPGDLYNLGDHVPWVYSHILETSTILDSMYPGYTHTSWRPLQSWRGWCRVGW